MEAEFTAALLAAPDLIGLLAISEAKPALHWDKLPDRKATPSLILHGPHSEGREYGLGGRIKQARFWVQMDCWAGSKVAAIEVRDALVAVLDTLTVEPLQAFEIIRDHASWDTAAGPDAKRSTDLYRASVDVRVVHTPT